METYFYLKIEFFCRGRALFDGARQEYPLHKAVFENNLPLISRLVNCQYEGVFYADKNELDICGNTPLNLAVKLGYVDVVKVLCDLFTCPKLKSFQNFPCALDIASALKNKEIIRILLEANQKIKQHYLDLHKEVRIIAIIKSQQAIFRALESIPDFKIDMHFNCKSNFIPFLKNITPSDTYKIYKQGSRIRLDMTLIGFRKFKCVRGNISVLFKGRGQENEGELFVVDHDMKIVQNIFNDIAQTKIDKDLEEILNEQQYQKLYKADKFKIDPELDKKGEIRQKMIEGYLAEKYQVKTIFIMTKFKVNVQEMQSLQKYKCYEEYIQKNSYYDSVFSSSSSLEKCENKEEEKEGVQSQSWNMFNMFSRNNDARIDTESDNQNQMFTQYKDQQVTNNTVMGYNTTDKKTTKKTIHASIWLSKQHPISLDSFFPLLHVLSFSSKQIAKFRDFLLKYQLPKGSFPLKANVPLFLTMKAAFRLQNLQFDIKDFPSNLFTIDEDYIKLRVNQPTIKRPIKKSRSSNSASQTLKEIYKLCKTNEDYEEEEEDSESLERANELFNSMLKKQVNQSEELLLEMHSFHSEHDSVDLSEKQINDESFKLQSHAFSMIQTMNSINVRHEGDEQINPQNYKTIMDYRNFQNQRYANNKLQGQNAQDIKMDCKNQINQNLPKRQVTKGVRPQNNERQYQTASDTVKTLKKDFQPRNLKNYKNMIKYGSQSQTIEEANQFKTAKKYINDPSSNTPPISTADCSILTNKMSTIFGTQSQLTRGQNAWFKQLLNNKNAILNGGAYLHTIESEEVMGTEGCENHSQLGKQIMGASSSAVVTQSNLDDVMSMSRKSFVQSFSNHNSNNPVNNSSRDSSLKSFNSGGQIQNQQSKILQSSTPNINKDEKKALVNHNSLISRFHNYISQQQQQTPLSNTSSITPQKFESNTPQQQKQDSNQSSMSKRSNDIQPFIILSSTSNNKQIARNDMNNNSKALLPPKVGHRKQNSYGGSGSETNVVKNVPQNIQAKPVQQQNEQQKDSSGLLSKLFGSSFSRTSINLVPSNQKESHDALSPFCMLPSNQALNQQAFQTFDHTKNSISRSASNTQYGQNPPPLIQQQKSNLNYSKGMLSNTMKKTNDVDIFLPYQV